MLLLLVILVVGAEVSATSPRKPDCPFPTGPYEQPKCGENEYFEICSYPCPSQNCSTLWTKYQCEETCCKPECRCKDGYLRDDKCGKCIRRDECLSPCGPLEHFVRDSCECTKTCANYKVNGPQSLCKSYTGCECNEGRVRLNDDGTGPCVLPQECPPRKCLLYEHWEDCPSVCHNETCISKSPNYKCLLPAIPLPCKPRCICDKGYLRNHFGQCIPEDHCHVKTCPVNEVWRCASMCPRDSCKTLEPGFKCPSGIVSVCIPACACKDGFLRNDKGHCVPRESCPRSSHCGINEVAVECATVYPPQTCESVYTHYKPVDKVPCKPGCDCRPGYLRNKHKICVPKEFCPTVPHYQCGPNQVYKECGTACEPSCSDLDNPNPNQLCTDQCVAGCFCKEGYLKDGRGNCVPRNKCPLPVCRGPNEVATECGSGCYDRTCENYKRTDIACPAAICIRGCFCIPGYVRNPYGLCVSPEQCPPEPHCLQANEEYQSCGSSCPDNCDNYLNTKRICTANCVAGCNCKAGFVRNLKDHTCVKPEQCPTKKCTGVNEFLNHCASYCPVTCANRLNNGNWLCGTVCRVACDCIPGTLRNNRGVCVPVEQCTPPVCRQNEKYLKCGTACPLTCDNYKNPPKVCTRQCIEDCFCEDGYVRDRHMRCVKPENCEPICPAGEKFNVCSAHCQDTCENYDKPNRICNYQCQSGCVCEAGTVRRKDGKCVKPVECSPRKCPLYEHWEDCPSVCQKETCISKSPDFKCLLPAIPLPCKPRCICDKGYLRNTSGQCIPEDHCPVKTCPVNEVWRCASMCPDSCKTLEPGFKCPPGIISVCIPVCVCRDGFLRNDKGHCIPRESCLPHNQCGPNQVYKECGTTCQQSCADLNNPNPNQVCTQQCVAGCFCKEGYLKDHRGNCIPRDKCPLPICNGPNEVALECGSSCNDRNCEDYKRTDIVCPAVCIRGCFCIPGYVRNAYGVCISPNQCPTKPVCSHANEEYQSCGSSCPDNCDNYLDTKRICTANCVPGCYCKAGFVRNLKDQTCVKPEKCPLPVCHGPNEVALECGSGCNDRTCEDYKRTDIVCPAVCIRGCFCIPGYVRNAYGVCISPNQCPQPTCSGDEVYDACSAHCEPTCENHGPNRACTAICVPGCKCCEGLVRRRDGQCVKLKDCYTNNNHPHPCSDPNAVRVECASQCPPTCANPNPGPCIASCKQNECVCKKGYILSVKGGRCIPVNQCPKDTPCNGDSNAVIKVKPLPCPSTCATPNASPYCKKYAPEIGCECKPGYLLSDVDGKCIKPDKCKGGNPCGVNGTFVGCHFSCPTDYCPVNDHRGVIFCSPPFPCPSGCACKLNYKKKSYKDNTYKCILASDCPPVKCTRQNEVWSPCPSACLRENCADVNNQPTTCNTLVLNCQPQCICKKGHFRNDKGLCVPANQCPNNKLCSDPNAERVHCAPAPHCRSTCAAPNPEPCIINCGVNECVCKKGFVLSKKGGKCVPVHQCPKDTPCNGDSHAVIKANPLPCPSTCKAPNSSPYCKKHAPEIGCECKPGYLKCDVSGKCIKPDECKGGNPCGVNGTFVECYFDCPTNNCPVNDSKDIIACTPPYVCTSGCACKSNYRKKSNKDNTYQCILASDCPPVKCTRQNEVWSPCPSACLRENCEHCNNEPTTCKKLALNCQPQCICKKGHYRDENGLCVPAKQCPNYKQCSDPNAVRVECAPAPHCRSTCATPNPGPCIKSCDKNECVCKKGYVLSEKGGRCVPVDKCPKDKPCNGDANAVITASPVSCPSTCKAPNASRNCKKHAPEVGCECKPGYLKSDDDGKCIKPDKCKGGNPCGVNGTFVECIDQCSSDNCPVNDHRGIIACTPPAYCPSGCACKPNYRKKTCEDNKYYSCILASECPPVKCTRQNEVWSPCPSACLQENCADINNKPSTCKKTHCQPQCICKEGHYRNDKGLCVPAKHCPKPIKCKANEVYKQCRITCPPQTCASIYTRYNCLSDPKCEPGCDCVSGYLRNGTEKDLCIPSSQCPAYKPVCGLNEHYEKDRCKCDLTCKDKDREELIGPCQETSGCFCDDGYYRNNKGICVTKKQCPKPITCPANEVLSECYNSCHTTCKTRIRGDGRVCHLACIDSGCLCKPGYLRHDNGTCVPVNECSPPRCNENETYSSCGTACPETCLNRGGNCTTSCTEDCVEGCFCNKGYVRADDDSCVKPKHCPPPTCSDPNEVYDKCPPTCPPGDDCSNIWSKYDCSKFEKCCKPGCRCKPGYHRKDGKCITTQQCIDGKDAAE